MHRYHTERIDALLPQVRRFVEDRLIPLEPELLQADFEVVHERLRALRPEVERMGLWNPYLSEAHGGPGLSLTEIGLLSAEMGRSPLGHFTFNAQAPDAGNIELLLQYATDDMRDRYLEPLLRGEIRSCFSMTEPATAGSNPLLLSTTARREGDEYVVSGHKWFTTAADGAEFAIVMAVTNPEADNPYARASMIIVPTDAEGFELVRNISIMGHPGSGWMSHSEIKYHDVRVPVSNRIGPEGKGFLLAQQRLGPGRIHHCMRWMGIAERSFEMLCRRAATREIAPGVMLGHKQMVQAWIAESRAEIDAARGLVLQAADRLEREGGKAAAEDISAIKFYASGVLHRVIDRAIQVHGALGVTDDTILAWFYREERGASIYDGTDETHKASLARKILKRYGLKRKG